MAKEMISPRERDRRRSLRAASSTWGIGASKRTQLLNIIDLYQNRQLNRYLCRIKYWNLFKRIQPIRLNWAAMARGASWAPVAPTSLPTRLVK